MRQLTDDELLLLPANQLTKQERSRRRRVKRRVADLKAQERKARAQGKEKDRANRCLGYNSKGEPCKSYRVKGAKHCMAHLNDAEKAKLGKKTWQEYGHEARRLAPRKKGATAPQLMREVVETAVEKIIERYFSALGLELKGWDEAGNPIVIDQGAEHGILLHGESKDGYIEMSRFPDLGAQIAIAEKLMDRTYGKPKQTSIIEGNPNRPIAVQPVKSAQRAQEVADLLTRVGAVPHGSRRRSQPSEPSGHPGVSEDANVTPLRPESSE